MFKKNTIYLPSLNETELEEYLKIKKLQLVVFDDEIKLDLENPNFREYIESEEFMDSLTYFLARNYLTKIADSNIKRNIYDLLFYLRTEKKVESKTERESLINEINSMISTLNNTTDEGNIPFYRKQFYNRSDQKQTAFWDLAYDEDFIEERKQSLNYSISSDFQSINDILYEDDEAEFLSEVAADNLVNHYFINTVNVLFHEMPALYNDKRFLERIKFILNNSKLLIKGKESIYELSEEDVIDKDLLLRTNKTLKKLKTISK